MSSESGSAEKRCPPHVAAKRSVKGWFRDVSEFDRELRVVDPNEVSQEDDGSVIVNVCTHCGALFIPVG